jgi:hypothetical protein
VKKNEIKKTEKEIYEEEEQDLEALHKNGEAGEESVVYLKRKDEETTEALHTDEGSD